ncbi:MAG: ATP-binding protein [Gallionella sp.]|nr:ATP-binding protein [Gallionella sp.]
MNDAVASRQTEHPFMVMLVDDQPFVAELLQRQLILEKDINFHYCQHASQAISTAEKIGPTVVLLDFTMPEIDGLTLCYFFRAHPATRDIPIIMLSSNDDPATKAEAFGAGANDYLVKLPDSVELIARLRYHSAAYTAKLQRDDAYRALRASQMKLEELNMQLLKLASFPKMDPNPVIEVNAAGIITYLNPAAGRFFPELTTSAPAPGMLGDISVAMKNGERQEVTREVVVGDVTFEQQLFPVPGCDFLRIYMRDITGRKRAEEKIRQMNEGLETLVQERTQQLLDAQEELVRKEKLSVLGQVAGSVGHELRNPLGVMNNAVYFLKTVLSDADDTTREYLNIIRDEIACSERIVSDLLDSVRTTPPHTEPVGVKEMIEQTLHRYTIPSSVTVKLDLPDALPPLRVDAMQIQQVLRNLISNGVEAMPDGGTLEIRAVENNQDGTVAVSVRDSGAGISAEILPKLFQPLFTTKASGIGLGLVVVKNLTQANGGKVEVASEAGKGALFTVTLPAVQDNDEHDA